MKGFSCMVRRQCSFDKLDICRFIAKKNGVVLGIKIVSEKGNACTVENPWNKKLVITAKNKKTITPVINGNLYTFSTKARETYMINSK